MTTERSGLINKWWVTGLLNGIKEHHLQRCAERLEEANKRGAEPGAVDRCLAAMQREGLFCGR